MAVTGDRNSTDSNFGAVIRPPSSVDSVFCLPPSGVRCSFSAFSFQISAFFVSHSFSQSASDGTGTLQKLKYGKLKAEIRHEFHELTRIDSVACWKIKLVTIGEIRVKGFVPVARTAPGNRISTPVPSVAGVSPAARN